MHTIETSMTMKPLGSILEHECPDCGSVMVLKTSKYGIFYGCVRYPSCEAAHGAHRETGEPLGVPAAKKSKEWRIRAHNAFDGLWKGDSRCMPRRKAYRWLQTAMNLDHEDAHIGRFDIDQCQIVIDMVSYWTKKNGSPDDWRNVTKDNFDSLWSGSVKVMSRKKAITAMKHALGRVKKDSFDFERLDILDCKKVILRVAELRYGTDSEL